jgi:hypothetical protein
MCAFHIEKCQVVWSKDATSENDRQLIIKELRGMSVEIWLSTEGEIGYTLAIYYDVHAAAWGMLLEEMDSKSCSPKVVGEIACMNPMTFRLIEPENILKTDSLSGL